MKYYVEDLNAPAAKPSNQSESPNSGKGPRRAFQTYTDIYIFTYVSNAFIQSNLQVKGIT